jgi:hypothetical protein
MYICVYSHVQIPGDYFCTLNAGIITYFVPCYIAGKNAEGIGEGCLVHGVYSVIPILGIYCHALIRGKIREQKNIEVCTYRDCLAFPPFLPPSVSVPSCLSLSPPLPPPLPNYDTLWV